jgi:hypothetical protein
MLEYKMRLFREHDKAKDSGTKTSRPEPVYVVLDDCMYSSKNWTSSEVVREIFLNGRHYRIFLIIAAQYLMNLPPDLRSNVDYVFITRENNRNNLEKLYKDFFGMVESKRTFFEIHDQACKNYGALVAHLTASSKKSLYWYKAKQIHDARVGSQEVWRASDNLVMERERRASASDSTI